jgi:hypothetical protein
MKDVIIKNKKTRNVIDRFQVRKAVGLVGLGISALSFIAFEPNLDSKIGSLINREIVCNKTHLEHCRDYSVRNIFPNCQFENLTFPKELRIYQTSRADNSILPRGYFDSITIEGFGKCENELVKPTRIVLELNEGLASEIIRKYDQRIKNKPSELENYYLVDYLIPTKGEINEITFDPLGIYFTQQINSEEKRIYGNYDYCIDFDSYLNEKDEKEYYIYGCDTRFGGLIFRRSI